MCLEKSYKKNDRVEAPLVMKSNGKLKLKLECRRKETKTSRARIDEIVDRQPTEKQSQKWFFFKK